MSEQILPPDPEDMNELRAGWATEILDTFRSMTGCEDDEALGDLLSKLRHACDRTDRFGVFDDKVAASGNCYLEEIGAPGTMYAGDEEIDAEYAAWVKSKELADG